MLFKWEVMSNVGNKLPNKQYDQTSPSDMSESKEQSRRNDRSTGKKRVMFEDQPNLDQQDDVQKDLFAQSDGKYQSSHLTNSQGYKSGSESEPQTLQKYPNQAQDYDHFHDESMSKLEAVLQRQRERLENLGGFSGKSSQISNGNENEQDLDAAYQNLEEEIYNIKKNFEASQTSEGYSPMKLDARNMEGDMEDSGMQEEMELSPSELQYEDN